MSANADPGGLTIRIDDHRVTIEVTGGSSFDLPIGPLALLDGPLDRVDPPPPANLTNALGLVHDHLDDVLIEAPSVAATPSVVALGAHAMALARTEVGSDVVDDDYVLERSAADEVFRTVAVESVADRRHNPGLPDSHVESIVATCCVILGIMRRLDLQQIGIHGAGTEGRDVA